MKLATARQRCCGTMQPKPSAVWNTPRAGDAWQIRHTTIIQGAVQPGLSVLCQLKPFRCGGSLFCLMLLQLEGSQCTLDDILDPELDVNANLNMEDVVNYVKAIQFALFRLRELSICSRLLREVHANLLDGVLGQEKSSGEFRRSQN